MPETRPTRVSPATRPLDEDARKRAAIDSVIRSREAFHRSIAGKDGEVNLPQCRLLDGDTGAADAHLSRAKPRPAPLPPRHRRTAWADWLAWALIIGAALWVLALMPAAFASARILSEAPAQW